MQRPSLPACPAAQEGGITMKKMLMALLLCAALLPLWAGACAAENTPVTIEPAEAFAGGSGTAEDPFQIATAQQLARWRR